MKMTVDVPENELPDAIRPKTEREVVVSAIAGFNRRRRIAELAGYAGTCPDLIAVDGLREQRRRRVESVGSE